MPSKWYATWLKYILRVCLGTQRYPYACVCIIFDDFALEFHWKIHKTMEYPSNTEFCFQNHQNPGLWGWLSGYIGTTSKPIFTKSPRIWTFQTLIKNSSKSCRVTLNNKKVRVPQSLPAKVDFRGQIVGGEMSLLFNKVTNRFENRKGDIQNSIN